MVPDGSHHQKIFAALGLLVGGSVMATGIPLGGAVVYGFSAVGYALLLAAAETACYAGGRGGTRRTLFSASMCAVTFAFIWCGVNGGGERVEWQDWIAWGMGTAYLTGALLVGIRTFWTWALVPISIFALVQCGVVVAQAAGWLGGHPMDWLVPGHGLGGGGAANFVSGTLATRSGTAAVLNMIGFFMVARTLWGETRAEGRIWAAWMAGVSFFCSLLCQARAGVIGMSFGMLFFVVASAVVAGRYGAKRLLSYGVAIGAAVACLGAIACLLYSLNWPVRDRMSAIFSDSYRVRLWVDAAGKISPEQFLWGIGPGGFRDWFLPFSGAGTGGDPVYLHNDWLEVFLEYGCLAGVILVLLFLLHLSVAISGAARRAGAMPATWDWPRCHYLAVVTGGGSALASLGAHAFFDYPLHTPVVALFGGLAAACCLAIPPGESRGHIGRRARGVAGSVVFLGFIVLFWRDLKCDFLAWKAEAEAARGDLHGAWETLGGTGGTANCKRHFLSKGSIAGKIALELGPGGEASAWLSISRAAYAGFLSAEPDSYEGLIGAGIASALMGDFPEAECFFKGAVARRPGSPTPYEWIGYTWRHQGRLVDAARAYRISLAFGGSESASRNLRELDSLLKKQP